MAAVSVGNPAMRSAPKTTPGRRWRNVRHKSRVWSRPEVLQRLREDYIIIALYTDDKTKLPESEWITSEFDGKVKKTMGKKNMDLQITRFSTNTQPYYVLVDPDGNTLAPPRGHNLDVGAFVEWLGSGVNKFRD